MCSMTTMRKAKKSDSLDKEQPMADEKKDKQTADAKEQRAERVLGDERGIHVGSVDDDDNPIDFGNFLMSLAHSAMIALGIVENPESGSKEVDLESARQTIEIIKILKTKTKGNLDEDEEKLIGSLLYELRISFVNASAQHATS